MVARSQFILQQAKVLATCGLRVIPLTPRSKAPYLQNWPSQATTDLHTIDLWWQACPEANVGVATGGNVVVVDLDAKPGKPQGLDTLGRWLDWDTVWAHTANGGYHLYYQHPGIPLVGKLAGVDIQQEGQQVVAPPSLLDGPVVWDRPGYRWGRAPRDWEDLGGIAPMPAGLIFKLARPATAATSSTDRPDLLPDPPPWTECWKQLKLAHQWFVGEGKVYEFHSRSELIHSLAARLYMLGYEDAQVLSMLWSSTWVQTAALDPQHNSAEHEERALSWLWGTCQKVRRLRRPPASETFRPVQPETGTTYDVPPEEPDTPPIKSYEALWDEAGRLLPGRDVIPFLEEMVVARLEPVQEDQVLHRVKDTSGINLRTLRQQVGRLNAQLRRQQAAQNRDVPRWVHTFGEAETPRATVENLELLLQAKGAEIRHNLMTHRYEITINGEQMQGEDARNSQLTQVESWAREYGMASEPTHKQLRMLAQYNAYHPFTTFVERSRWDGHSRLPRLLNTIRVPEGKERIRDLLVRKWLISVVAAVYGYNNRPPRGVLTFVGPQMSGKTTWLHYLVPSGMYHQGLLLRPSDRDSAVKGLRYLITELGEVGSTFKHSDIEQLKAYIGQREDVYRLPYAHEEANWARRTVFAASANRTDLLQDMTGNSRWWVVPVESFDLDLMEKLWGNGTGSEMQQLWAEVYELYRAGEAHDLTDEELWNLETHLEDHREVGTVEERVLEMYEWQYPIPAGGYREYKRQMDIWSDLKVLSPTRAERAELRAVLQRMTGRRGPEQRHVQMVVSEGARPRGVVGKFWRVPPKKIPGMGRTG